MKQTSDYAIYGPTLLRIFAGLLFILPGFMKLFNPSGIIGMLTNLGFPAAAFFGWILIISEIMFGLTVLLGIKLRYTVWPLVIILAVALVTVAIPKISEPMGMIGVLWHLLGISALISLALTGPGMYGIDSKE